MLCAIVLACKVLKYKYVMGVNPFAETEENASLSDENCNGKKNGSLLDLPAMYEGRRFPASLATDRKSVV